MLSLTFLFTSLLLSFAAAQTNNTIDPNSVDLTTRIQWCQGETANCPLLCGGQIKNNVCTGATLDYTCTCANGSPPANIADYLDTLPNHICNQIFANCRQANPGSQACKTCGTLTPSLVQVVATSSSSAASSSTGTPTTSTTATPSTGKSGAGRIEAVGAVVGGAIGLAAVML